MKQFVSLWSADQLDLGRAVDLVDDLVDGFHVDVFDGHDAFELLYGPDLVAALRRRTRRVVDVHLNVTDPDAWVPRFADAGADVITVQSGPCPDVGATLAGIRACGCAAGLGLELHEPVELAGSRFGEVARVLVMGTETGVKGRDLDPGVPDRVAALDAAGRAAGWAGDLVVDGGIRRHTVPRLVRAGADGVIPGSLVYGDPDPRRAATAVRDLTAAAAHEDFWAEPTAPVAAAPGAHTAGSG
jgi:ribulose-phosphate 3-epimerase